MADGVEPSTVTEATASEAVVSEAALTEAALVEANTWEMLRANGPRLAANGGLPILSFYAGWKLSGLLLGVILATAVGVGAYLYDRRRQRPGLVARLALLFVFVQ